MSAFALIAVRFAGVAPLCLLVPDALCAVRGVVVSVVFGSVCLIAIWSAIASWPLSQALSCLGRYLSGAQILLVVCVVGFSCLPPSFFSLG